MPIVLVFARYELPNPSLAHQVLHPPVLQLDLPSPHVALLPRAPTYHIRHRIAECNLPDFRVRVFVYANLDVDRLLARSL